RVGFFEDGEGLRRRHGGAVCRRILHDDTDRVGPGQDERAAEREIEVPGYERARPVRADAHERLTGGRRAELGGGRRGGAQVPPDTVQPELDRKSTRLNSSHEWISY